MNSKLKIQNLKFFILLIVHYSLFTACCFAQFGRDSYELDGLNKREVPEIQVSTNLKSSLFSYAYIFPLTTLSKALYLDFNFGCKMGLWIDKRISTGVNSTGFIMIPVGTGITFRKWNPVNFSLMGGAMAGFKADNLFTKGLSNSTPDHLVAVGFYLSGSIFIPLRNKLGIEMSYDRIFLPELNKLSYIAFGMVFGKYE